MFFPRPSVLHNPFYRSIRNDLHIQQNPQWRDRLQIHARNRIDRTDWKKWVEWIPSIHAGHPYIEKSFHQLGLHIRSILRIMRKVGRMPTTKERQDVRSADAEI
jgi:hypothetical protein